MVDGRDSAWRNRAPGPHAHRNTARQATDGLWTEVCGQQKQSNDSAHVGEVPPASGRPRAQKPPLRRGPPPPGRGRPGPMARAVAHTESTRGSERGQSGGSVGTTSQGEGRGCGGGGDRPGRGREGTREGEADGHRRLRRKGERHRQLQRATQPRVMPAPPPPLLQRLTWCGPGKGLGISLGHLQPPSATLRRPPSNRRPLLPGHE